MAIGRMERTGFALQSGLERAAVKLAASGSAGLLAARGILAGEGALRKTFGGVPIIGPLFHFKAGGISLTLLDRLLDDLINNITALSLQDIAKIKPHQIKRIPLGQIKLLTTDQIDALTPHQVSELTLAQVATFSARQIAAFTPKQIEAMSGSLGVLAQPELDESIGQAFLGTLKMKGAFAIYYKVLLRLYDTIANRGPAT